MCASRYGQVNLGLNDLIKACAEQQATQTIKSCFEVVCTEKINNFEG